ncbi:hypothetical protein GCM10009663_16340 [Kitasatospora arboriphila]|uniref:Uncharacterized protein n=1 Tax=Kitasatospora arboriphila TaxID=258052 RepID=A0ABP4DWR1_9ACTN
MRHPVDRDRGEQRLHTGDGGDRQDHGEQVRPVLGEQPAARGRGECMVLPAGQFDPGEVQAEGEGEGRARGDGDEGGRQPGEPCADPAGGTGQAAEAGPAEEHGDGERADRQGRQVGPGQLTGERAEVGEGGALRRSAKHDVELGDGDGEAHARQHPVHDRRGDGERRAGHAQRAEQELEQAGRDGHRAGDPPAVLGDHACGDHGQGRRGAADLEGSAAEQTGHQAAGGGGDQACRQRRAGGEGDAEGEGHRDEEDRQRGRQVVEECGAASAARPPGAGSRPGRPAAGRRRVVGGVRGDGCGGDVEGHGVPSSGGTYAVRSGGGAVSGSAVVDRDGVAGWCGRGGCPRGPRTISPVCQDSVNRE